MGVAKNDASVFVDTVSLPVATEDAHNHATQQYVGLLIKEHLPCVPGGISSLLPGLSFISCSFSTPSFSISYSSPSRDHAKVNFCACVELYLHSRSLCESLARRGMNGVHVALFASIPLFTILTPTIKQIVISKISPSYLIPAYEGDGILVGDTGVRYRGGSEGGRIPLTGGSRKSPRMATPITPYPSSSFQRA